MIVESMRFNLSCYKCGSIDFVVKKMPFNDIENMYFLHNDSKQLLICLNCGLEDYVDNLVPRAFLHEELIDG